MRFSTTILQTRSALAAVVLLVLEDDAFELNLKSEYGCSKRQEVQDK
jgi:hypothetical protein